MMRRLTLPLLLIVVGAALGSWNFKAPFYVAGFLVFVGAVMGRLVCGWLCPFGLIQELLHKIPFPKKIRTFRGDRLLRKAKYVIFVLFVVLLPLCLVDALGQGSPYFCKLLCPVGALEGGLPLQGPAGDHRLAVCLEDGAAGRDDRRRPGDLPAFLQVPLSAGGGV